MIVHVAITENGETFTGFTLRGCSMWFAVVALDPVSTPTPSAQAAQSAPDIHERGVKRFGAAWMLANREALRIAQAHRLDTERHAPMLARFAWSLLTWKDIHTERRESPNAK